MAQCLTPLTIKNKKTNESIAVPCSRCPACLKRRASGWSFRLMQEAKQAYSAYFVTLTYGNDHAKKIEHKDEQLLTKNGFLSIRKPALQRFFKRLRKYQQAHNPEAPPIRYYAVGEYGSKSGRPHYHIILFNADIHGISHAWPFGHIHFGDVSAGSVGYCLKYMSKPKRIPMHQRDDRIPEFSLMSKGIGKNYLTPQMIAWHKADMLERMFCPIEDGKKIAMPRYYKDRIYAEHERKRIAFFAKQKIVKEELQKLRDDPEYYAKKAISDQGQFDRMHYHAELGRTKI